MQMEWIRNLIRKKLQDGRLPRGRAVRFWGGPGAGQLCDACETPVTSTGALTMPAGIVTPPPTTVSAAPPLVTITNVGTTTLTFTGVTLSGANSADFTTNLANPPCAGTLAAGANCSFTLYFTPSIVGAEKASLNTFDNTFGSPQVLPVAGTGQ